MKTLSDEEIKERWLEGYKEQNLTLDEYDLEYLSDNLYFEGMYALRVIARKAEEERDKQWIAWGNEPCEEHHQRIYRRQCPFCWQEVQEPVNG